MRNILRDPGAEVVVSLFSFSASFIAIGLAIFAVAESNTSVPLTKVSYIAFALAALLFIVALIASIVLFRDLTKTKGYIRQIGEFLRQGRELRGELLLVRREWTEEMQGKVPQWKANVQQWLHDNLLEYEPGFDVEGFLVNLDTGEGVNGKASNAAQHLESRMSNLKEILREIRR
jgi:hypothetical protein